MMDEALVNNWSDALFQLAKANDTVDQYVDEVNGLINLFAQYPEFLDIVANRSLDVEVRDKIILHIFQGRVDQYILNFFLVLMHKGYFRYCRYILKNFRKKCNDYQDFYYGVVYSIIPLTPVQLQKIKVQISHIMQHETKIINKLDPRIIGGVKIKIQNRIFDGSIQGRLEDLKKTLLNQTKGEN